MDSTHGQLGDLRQDHNNLEHCKIHPWNTPGLVRGDPDGGAELCWLSSDPSLGLFPLLDASYYGHNVPRGPLEQDHVDYGISSAWAGFSAPHSDLPGWDELTANVPTASRDSLQSPSLFVPNDFEFMHPASFTLDRQGSLSSSTVSSSSLSSFSLSPEARQHAPPLFSPTFGTSTRTDPLPSAAGGSTSQIPSPVPVDTPQEREKTCVVNEENATDFFDGLFSRPRPSSGTPSPISTSPLLFPASNYPHGFQDPSVYQRAGEPTDPAALGYLGAGVQVSAFPLTNPLTDLGLSEAASPSQYTGAGVHPQALSGAEPPFSASSLGLTSSVFGDFGQNASSSGATSPCTYASTERSPQTISVPPRKVQQYCERASSPSAKARARCFRRESIALNAGGRQPPSSASQSIFGEVDEAGEVASTEPLRTENGASMTYAPHATPRGERKAESLLDAFLTSQQQVPVTATFQPPESSAADCGIARCGRSGDSQKNKPRSTGSGRVGSGPWICQLISPKTDEVCMKGFRRAEHLKRHQRTHNFERPFACELCGRAFTRTDNLNQHRKTHDNRDGRNSKLLRAKLKAEAQSRALVAADGESTMIGPVAPASRF